MDKPFLSYDQQIQLLQKRGLIIKNQDFAHHALSTLSYYDLINRYKVYFMNPDDTFIDGISIEYLYNFYLFDKEVQAFIMKYSVLIESIFKTRFSYVLAKHYGVQVKDYLNKYHYKSSPKGSYSFITIESKILKWLSSKNVKNPTKHYKENHDHIPPWILFKNITLGNTINLYDLLKDTPKYELADSILSNSSFGYDAKFNFILHAMNTVRRFRNAAAHNLNFTGLRIPRKYTPSPSIMYSLLGTPLLEKRNKKITSVDKESLLGLYSAMLSMIIFLDSSYLKSVFIEDFLLILDKENIRKEMYAKYAAITNMPLTINQRFTEFYRQLKP
ncbi:Abi family protein [Megasphaera sp.]|uniref:Abi family protein n=1 Tax=Megasphaera sp. TaxID=2023260 RepID=UPI003AB1D196